MERDDTRNNFDHPHRGAAPAGMTPADVEGRFELARYLDTSRFPASAAEVQNLARSANAPDFIIAELDRLSDGRYDNVTDIWQALGHGTEAPRSGMEAEGP
ncbi:MAG: DUF2795 domain-containing protein [Stackebrandtia sp.]